MNIIEKINAALNKHFKSNKGNVTVDYAYPFSEDKIRLESQRPSRVDVRHMCVFIFRQEPDVQMIIMDTWIFTRETINRAGNRFKV